VSSLRELDSSSFVPVNMTNDEDAICDLLDDFARALYEKDAAGAIAPLAPDAVAFDLAPPLKQDTDVMHGLQRMTGTKTDGENHPHA
jgi:ketosteroid isomerase-like protein